MEQIEDILKTLAARIKNHAETIQTEEAVKTSIILPFLRALGYDVFNPLEVIPEFTADAVGKKGEKVDYAIFSENEVRILIECKALSSPLETKHLSQLYRYFSVTNAKFAILTNGRYFQFYTDLDEKNKLDARPFFTFDITEYNANTVNELKKFEKRAFDIDTILATAERLKYTSGIKQNILKIMENPPENFVRLVCADIYGGRLTANVLEMLSPLTKNAFREIITELVQSRLSSALNDTSATDEKLDKAADSANDLEIITTEEEIEAHMIAKNIAREIISVERVVMRDAKSYCAILLDNNNRKPLIRLYFNAKIKRIGLFDKENEEKIEIETIDDIYKYADSIKNAAQKYLQ
ncbi:type I restriction endonuclease [Candidatus Tokpelaia sp.]|uniref:type I restriction endonuclease n=1 Tax=Candidatus Tokpelaia sp. TaxID=2233777 RepID=UPI00123AC5A1|nr:type I restriction endonuclease [Candidatus Tokpelaia sp.]KAA6405111.1 restriction endonuclease [Candidatus Tokpelaia sp.]